MMSIFLSTPVLKKYGGLLTSVLILSQTSIADAAPVGAALDRPSIFSEQAAHSFLLGAARAGNRLVAVGERGIVILSDDSGATWRQIQSPVSVTLTVVRFADSKHGYAAGHGGCVLVTSDGGETWTRSLDGRRAAEIVLGVARESGDAGAVAEAERLLEDGPDKPFFDVLVRDSLNVVVVGAYGLALATEDGGKSWSSWGSRINNPSGLHLNAIRRLGEKIVIVGEHGLVRLSENDGATFSSLQTPYSGSYFTVEMPSAGVILIAGLRGNILLSEDSGANWTPLSSPVPASITASAVLPNGDLLLANQAGMITQERAGHLVPINAHPMPPLNNLLALPGERIVVLSGGGVATLNPGDYK